MDIDSCLAQVKRLELLPEHTIRLVLERLKDILLEESNVQPVDSPVTLCGDIHGQFHDLAHLLELGGDPSCTRYIFIGDFVDRGYHSVETLSLLACLKVKHPDQLSLLRGNHESRAITTQYGFYDECLRKYGNTNVWKYACDMFDCLPLAAVVDSDTLVLHGGLSPDIRTLDMIRQIDRCQEIPVADGPFRDMMWSDPEDLEQGESWRVSRRGAGWLFGAEVTSQFLHLNQLSLICRAHQLVQEGYKYWFSEQLVTVWSAPNYCYRCGNEAAFLRLQGQEREFRVFSAQNGQRERESQPGNVLPYFL